MHRLLNILEKFFCTIIEIKVIVSNSFGHLGTKQTIKPYRTILGVRSSGSTLFCKLQNMYCVSHPKYSDSSLKVDNKNIIGQIPSFIFWPYWHTRYTEHINLSWDRNYKTKTKQMNIIFSPFIQFHFLIPGFTKFSPVSLVIYIF